MLLAGGLGVLGVWPPFAVVMSGSMAPTINTGDMVVLERLRAPAQVGQVVAVPVPDDVRARYGYPPVVIHRVVRIAGGQIRTKGDARPTVDPFTVPRSAVNARVIAHIPAGGRVLAFFRSAPGILWLLFGGALFFGLPLLDRVRDARREETAASAGLGNQVADLASELARLQAEQERSRQSADDALVQLASLTALLERALADRSTAVPANGTSGTVPRRAEPIVDVAPQPPVDAASDEDEQPSPAQRTATAVGAPRGPETPGSVVHPAAPAVARAVKPCPAALGERWDAPPPASASADASTGWAAPPPVHSGRFRRTGRLVAASLAQTPASA